MFAERTVGLTHVKETSLCFPGHEPFLQEILICAICLCSDGELVGRRRTVLNEVVQREQATVLGVVREERREMVYLISDTKCCQVRFSGVYEPTHSLDVFSSSGQMRQVAELHLTTGEF